MPPRPRPPIDRFNEKVDRSGGPDACWLWTAATFTTTGYGVFHPSKGETTTAHRWIYVQVNGDPGPDLFVDHMCHNTDPDCPGGRDCYHRACVNPAHLGVKTNDANVKASPRSNHRKTHCPRNHPYTPNNTRVQVRPNTRSRKCIQCERERDQARPPRRRKVS